MHTPAEKLPNVLAHSPLAPIHLIVGDEPLQGCEALDAVLAAARAAGFGDRTVLEITGRKAEENQQDWERVRGEIASPSIFSPRRIIDLRLPDAKPGAAGAKLLGTYAEAPDPDIALIVVMPKLDRRARQAQWFKSIERRALVVSADPIAAPELADWLVRRAAHAGLQLTPEAAGLLSERAEGNLLAAAQEITKLELLQGPGPVDATTVRKTVGECARYDAFEAADAMLGGDPARAVRVLHGLAAEGTAPQLVVWVLLRELRALAAMVDDLESGMRRAEVLERHRVWGSRKALVAGALGRLPPARWRALLRLGFAAEDIVKGAPGSPWGALRHLALAACGAQPPGAFL